MMMKCAFVLVALCVSSVAAGNVLRGGAKETPVDRAKPLDLIAKFNRVLPGLLPAKSSVQRPLALANVLGDQKVKDNQADSPFILKQSYANKIQLDQAKQLAFRDVTMLYAEANLMKMETTGVKKPLDQQKKELATLRKKLDDVVKDMLDTGLIRLEKTDDEEYAKYLKDKDAGMKAVKEMMDQADKTIPQLKNYKGRFLKDDAPGGVRWIQRIAEERFGREQKRMWKRWQGAVPNVRLSAITSLDHPAARFNKMVREIFDALDKDMDSKLSRAEYNELELLVDGQSGVFPTDEEYAVLVEAVPPKQVHVPNAPGLTFLQVNELYLNPEVQQKFNTQLPRDYVALLERQKVRGMAVKPENPEEDGRELALLTMFDANHAKKSDEVPVGDANLFRKELTSSLAKAASKVL